MSTLLSVQLGPLKEKWLQYCRDNKTTSSAAIKQIISKLTAKSPASEPPTAEVLYERPDERPKRRMVLRWTVSETEQIQKRAELEGCSLQFWITSLVRAHLTKRPQFGMVEIDALGESSKQLLAIGRNLNQLVRSAKRGEVIGIDEQQLKELQKLSAHVYEHTDKVSIIIAANIDRWMLK